MPRIPINYYGGKDRQSIFVKGKTDHISYYLFQLQNVKIQSDLYYLNELHWKVYRAITSHFLLFLKINLFKLGSHDRNKLHRWLRISWKLQFYSKFWDLQEIDKKLQKTVKLLQYIKLLKNVKLFSHV